ncbi:28674_t:CDS:2 [Gigaspora margarita]|uniref:28674_t:CDS:1 n=1 Tax=Gigaspora margarita TaxID=4874 RepID=A0ABN7UL02_GIGMA|nr:28674_t:CDS:2 [Gigaspora margarita]
MNISQQHMSIILPSEQLSARETLDIDTPELVLEHIHLIIYQKNFHYHLERKFLLTNNNNVRSNIDANTEMDEQTVDQILTNLQNNNKIILNISDTLREMSQGNSSRNQ